MIQKPEYPIKMIAIDLDDTLIRDDTTVSDYTKDTIRRAQQKGIHIMIATGRMYATASPMAACSAWEIFP
jgi:hydroxymethylpyrimidine pyrophosphatase-like HAD family hydrolase